MNRILYKSYQDYGLRLASIDGGGLRNAIPRESNAIITLPTTSDDKFKSHLEEVSSVIKAEYDFTDPHLSIHLETVDSPSKVMNEDAQNQLCASIYSAHNGIYRMSPEIPDLVLPSNIVARVIVSNGEYQVLCLTRSSVDSEKYDLANALEACFNGLGGVVTQSGDYPGWQPRPSSDVVNTMRDLYVEMYNEEPHVMACHAGLECGILGTNYPDMDMVSFGPNIRGAHSPDEKVQISSVQKYWKYTLNALERIG
ncbi:MAG: M20/M25/M40 family metallo-hydrolase [Flavobacteriales bacterium]|nr:M20/M25/M40 family metallo-hydrolase [Flavobacteriales bacterium]